MLGMWSWVEQGHYDYMAKKILLSVHWTLVLWWMYGKRKVCNPMVRGELIRVQRTACL